MNKYESLNQTFKDLSCKFQEVSDSVSEYEEGLNLHIKDISDITKEQISCFSDLEISKTFALLQSDLSLSCENIINRIEQSKKNMNFRDKFNDSMLVYVYGKVKSGKSSLGNFIAHGKTNPKKDEIDKSVSFGLEIETVINCRSDEEKKRLEQQRHAIKNESKFGVDFFEATSSIQYFKKPGLTWVDSPGIHSTTKENGELAKKYLGSADLVIYTTTFRSACQDSDQEEILELFKSHKPVVVVVTRSDDEDIIDIDDDGKNITQLIMRSDEDCNKVKNWCVNSISELLGDSWKEYSQNLQNRVITVSCLYAEKNFNDKGLKESHIDELCSLLENIATSEGVKIKQNTPRNAAVANIELVIDVTKQMHEKIDNLVNKLKDFKEDFSLGLKEAESEIKQEIKVEINNLVDKYYGDDASFSEAVDAYLKKKIADCLVDFNDKISKQTAAISKNAILSFNEIKIEKFEDIIQTSTYVASSKRGLFSSLGTIVGGLVGLALGPVGAAAGAVAGGMLGNKIGSSYTSNNTTYTKVGDNRGAVARNTIKQAQEQIEKCFGYYDLNIQANVFKPFDSWINRLNQAVNECNTFAKDQHNKF